jgi:hypothetical protein
MTDSIFGKTMIGSTLWEIKHYWQQHILGKKNYWQHILGKTMIGSTFWENTWLVAHYGEKTWLAAHSGKNRQVILLKIYVIATHIEKKHDCNTFIFWEKNTITIYSVQVGIQ